MSNHPLIQYVNEARRRGMSSRQIIQALTTAGWQVHDIAEIFITHELVVSSPVETPIDSGDNIISVRKTSKLFGKFKALDSVDIDVKRGSVTALLGPNGAGKTTLVRILTTLLKPDAGMVRVAGFDPVRDANHLRSVIGLAGQYAAVDEILSGRENLIMAGQLYHLPRAQVLKRADELLKQFELDDAANRSVRTYSGGMRRRLDLAMSLIIRPKILFLDEPTTGLDPRSRFALWHVIRDLVEDGTTVLLTTQYLEEADQLADKIFVIDHGRIIAQGTADELKQEAGGDVLELHMTHHKDANRASEAIRGFGSGEPTPDHDTGVITMPVSGGASILVDVVRQLDNEGLKISDLILRRPSLDDVFMKLTGHHSEETQNK